MCEEYEITRIIGSKTITKTIENECNKKPARGTIKQYSKYKFIPAGSSYLKMNLPA
jgi:hypothetical protein